MPHDVTQFMRVYEDEKKELDAILENAPDRERYDEFVKWINEIRVNNEALSALEENDEQMIQNEEPVPGYISYQKNKEAYRKAIQEADRILSGAEDPDDNNENLLLEEPDDTPMKMKAFAREFKSVLENDYALLYTADPLNITSMDDAIAKGRSILHEVEGEIRLSDNESPIRLEADDSIIDNVTERGTFRKTEDKTELAFYEIAQLCGAGNVVQPVKPVILSDRDKLTGGLFIREVQGFSVKDVREDSPVLSIGVKNFENPAVFRDLADAQALDYICGTRGRGKEHFVIRYSGDEEPLLTGFNLTHGVRAFQPEEGADQELSPEDMGVVSERFYNSLKNTTEAAFLSALKRNGIGDAACSAAWKRRNDLLKKIEDDMEYFRDKAPGYSEAGHIRIVKDEEWENLTVKTLADTHKKSYFSVITEIPEAAKQKLAEKKNGNPAIDLQDEIIEAPVPQAKKVSVLPDADLPGAEDDVVRLAIPELSKIKSVGGCLSTRYAVSYKEGNKEHKAFFTAAKEYSYNQKFTDNINKAIKQYPEFSDFINDVKEYCSSGISSPEELKRVFSDDKVEVPFKEMGYSEEEARLVKEKQNFESMWKRLCLEIRTSTTDMEYYVKKKGFTAGQRIELKNVAMSDIADTLGVPHVLARSRKAQVESGGHMIEGVIMDQAPGLDLGKLSKGQYYPILDTDPLALVNCFNSASAMKDIADLQILDYICLNRDRHTGNMIYQFDYSDPEKPVLKGVRGIDNDLSFGTDVPNSYVKISVWLPKLEDICMISREMYDRIRDPKTMIEIREKMHRNGFSYKEMDAVKRRIDQIKERVDMHYIEVVESNKWGHGLYSFERLAHGEYLGEFPNYFYSIKKRVIGGIKHEINKRKKKSGEKDDQKKTGIDIPFTKARLVTDFGSGLLEDKELKGLEEKAREDYLRSLETRMANIPDLEDITFGKDSIRNIYKMSKDLYKGIDAADPTLMKSSPEYRELKKTCNIVVGISKYLSTKYRNDPKACLTAAESYELGFYINKLNDTATAYRSYKLQSLDGREPNKRESPRLLVSERVGGLVTAMKKAQYMNKLQNPMQYLRGRENLAKAALTGATGQDLKNKIADVLYLNMLSQVDLEKRNNKQFMKLLTEEEIIRGRNEIFNTRGIDKILSLPEDELRSMGAEKNARKLVGMYKKELAKNKQAEVKKNKAQKKQDNDMIVTRVPLGHEGKK